MQRILIVDDKEENLDFLRGLLERHGWAVETAEHGAEALVKARQHPPHLIVSDLLMPFTDGSTLLRHWKTDERLTSIPFIVYAATATEAADEKRASALGAAAFIVKPAEPGVFMARVREVMEKSRREETIPRPPRSDEPVILKHHSEALVRKLEEKQLELEEANRKLAAREARLRAIFDAEPECVKLLAADGSLLEMNPAGLRMLEADSFEQVRNCCVYPLVAEEYRGAFSELTANVFRGESGVLEFQIVGLKGGRRWLETHASPLRERGGAITALLGITRDITERKRTEAALQESEERFSAFMATMPIIAFIKDPEGRLLYVNDAFERAFGMKLADWKGKTDAELWPPETARRLRANDVRILGGGQPVVVEEIVERPTGPQCWISHKFPFRDGQGRHCLAGTASNITERKAAEAAVLASRSLLEGIHRVQADFIAAGDSRTTFNDLLALLLKLTRSDYGFIGEVLADAHDQPYLKAHAITNISWNEETRALYERSMVKGFEFHNLQTLFGAVMTTGQPVIANDPANDPRRGGLPHWHPPMDAFLGLPLHRAGQLIGMIGVANRPGGYGESIAGELAPLLATCANLIEAMRNEASRRAAEAGLRESEERFRELAETVREVFWISDPSKNRILYISPAYEKVWGRSCQSLYEQPRTWREALHPDDRERVLLAATTRQTEGTYDEEYRIVRPDGGVRWIRDQAFPVRNTSGLVERIVGVARDITESKQLQEQFLRAQRSDAIGTLAGGIAHDLNNIFSPVMMGASLLQERIFDPADREVLKMIQFSAERGSNVVRQLLTFSRGIEGKRVSVQLRHLVKEMFNIMQETFPRDIVLYDDVPRDLWPVNADPTQLHQVFLNLCVNARDAMPSGGKLSVTAKNTELSAAEVEAHPPAKPGPHVVFVVADTGEGIPPGIIDRIFDPFFTTREPGKGTGLGLSTVVGIVRSHDGFLTVASTPREGTVFTVYLPATPAALVPAVPPASDSPMGHGELILVVDDESSVRQATRLLLQASRYTVVTATNGAEAEEIFRSRRPEVRLVITDLMMPESGGVPLIRVLRALSPKIPIIVTSGLIDKAIHGQVTAAGATCLLDKPFRSSALLGAIHEELARGHGGESPGQ